ncbi:nucleotidyl transferase AbiEii/AbiGii toxin family protein [Limnohabitans sp. DM1]|uniref:nucleotidyl transferase AbiEii/AbiGii toxin family protein n=1 Tax=Limnohabitans sp. DM1 TaxID=1597955 RepID=UPI000AA5124C
MSRNTEPLDLPLGIWQTLLPHAFTLIDEIARLLTPEPFWTFGGGTVLMLRHQHRMSKDIDIFVPDPQYLGFVSPRLSDAAENVSQDSSVRLKSEQIQLLSALRWCGCVSIGLQGA